MEAASKNRRGRPKSIGLDYSLMRSIYPDVTDRQLANNIYMIKALRILLKSDGNLLSDDWKNPIFKWLRTKNGILSELGRLSELVSIDYTLDMARQVCEMKPKTHDGERILRQHRLKLKRNSR